MSELSENITEQLAAMPQAEQIYYAQAIERGKENIFQTISELKNPENTPSEYRTAGDLALAQLTEMLNGVATPRAKSESDALTHVYSEIDQAKEAGDTGRVAMLEEAVRKTAMSAVTPEEAAAHQHIHDSVQQEMVAARQAEYEEALTEASEVSLRALRRQMPPDEAIAFFKQHEEPKIRGALENAYGIGK